MNRILVVEDDKNISDDLQKQFSSNEYDCTVVYDGFLAEKLLDRQTFDCIVMDINIPGKNGYELCKSIRSKGITTPVLMLTAFSDVDDKLEGFSAGADDYLTKPFYFQELLARVKVLLKRKPNADLPVSMYTVDDLVIDETKREVRRNNIPVILTLREFSILLLLVKNIGRAVSKKELIEAIWNTKTEVNTNTVEVFINSLRNKIDKGAEHKLIQTKIGYGYYIHITI